MWVVDKLKGDMVELAKAESVEGDETPSSTPVMSRGAPLLAQTLLKPFFHHICSCALT
jgi:hypothetical protein